MSNPSLTIQSGRGTGSGAAIRERAEGRIPGIIYGVGLDPTPISVERADLRHALNTDRGANALLDVTMDGKALHAVVKEIQRHPVRRDVIHVDFESVTPDKVLNVTVPVVLVGSSKEVTTAGGMIEQKLGTVKIRVKASDIPAALEADISGLTIGRSLQVKDLGDIEGVRVMTDPLKALASAQLTRAAVVAQRAERGS